LLGMGERTSHRWCRRYEEESKAGLLHPSVRGRRCLGLGLPLGLYIDRVSYYFLVREAVGADDHGHPVQIGGALAHPALEHLNLP
jgi:hypothetical protein